MSIKTRLTLNNVIHEFQTLIDSHLMINSFYYGNFLTIYESNTIKYSTLLMNVNNATVDEYYYHLTVELMTMDKVFKDISNRIDVENDSLSNLQDVFSVIKTSNRWQSFSKVTQQSQMRKFVNKGEDQVTGWAMTLQLSIKRENGICDLPIENYDYDGEYTPKCAGVSVYEDGVFVEVVPSGGRYDYSTSCNPANIEINGFHFVDADSGETENIQVVDNDDRMVGSKVNDKWVIDFSQKRVYQRPMFSGQDVSFWTGDIGWRIQNNIGDFDQPNIGKQMRLQFGKQFLLEDNNVFGNVYRWTGTDGGYYDPITDTYRSSDGTLSNRVNVFPDGLFVDHLISYVGQVDQSGLRTWYDWIDYGLNLSIGDFTGFYLPSVPEIVNFGNWGITFGYRDNTPFNWGNGGKLTADSYTANNTQCMIAQSYNHIASTPKANSNKAILVKPIDLNSEFG